jgi:hypothetical protein
MLKEFARRQGVERQATDGLTHRSTVGRELLVVELPVFFSDCQSGLKILRLSLHCILVQKFVHLVDNDDPGSICLVLFNEELPL